MVKEHDESIIQTKAKRFRSIKSGRHGLGNGPGSMNYPLHELIDRIRHFGAEYLSLHAITFEYLEETDLPDKSAVKESGDSIFQAVKEALHDIAEFSGATSVILNTGIREGTFYIIIKDDRQSETGNEGFSGLKNMMHLIGNTGGDVFINHEPDKGCTVMIMVPEESLIKGKRNSTYI